MFHVFWQFLVADIELHPHRFPQPWEPTGDGELQLEAGAKVRVLDKTRWNNADWWKVQRPSEEGWVPANVLGPHSFIPVVGVSRGLGLECAHEKQASDRGGDGGGKRCFSLDVGSQSDLVFYR